MCDTNVYIYFFGLSKYPINSWTIWIVRGNKCSKENHSLVKCFGYIVFHTPRFTVKGSNAWIEDQESMQRIWSSVKTPMFSLDDREKQLGLGSKGVSTYFTPNCNQDDAELVNRCRQPWHAVASLSEEMVHSCPCWKL